MTSQPKQLEWTEQWEMLYDQEGQTQLLFWEWVSPLKPEDFKDKRVLDAGCGGGHMLSYIEPLVASAVGLDLNTSDLARGRFANSKKIRVCDGDIARWNDESDFDIVYCIGVAHHTQDPKASVRHLHSLVRPGGQLAIWVYGHEGNFWVRLLVEKPKKLLFSWMPRPWLWALSTLITALLYPIVYTVYSLPLPFLPYFRYFQSFKRLTFRRNAANVFDKLNAPTTHFIRRSEIDQWFEGLPVQSVTVTPWVDISWRVLVRKPA